MQFRNKTSEKFNNLSIAKNKGLFLAARFYIDATFLWTFQEAFVESYLAVEWKTKYKI